MNPQELFSSLEQRYQLPEGYLARVYQAESSSGKNLYNEQSGAAGPFQFMPRTAQSMGLKDPYDLAQSAEAAARLAVQNRTYLQKKGVEDVDGRTLYLAHAQGAEGAYRLLSNPEQPAVSLVGEKAVTQNAGKKDQASSDFANQLMSKYEGGEQQNRPYSALGTSEPVAEQAMDQAAMQSFLEGPETDRTERKRMYALNTLMGLTRELQGGQTPRLLPIPRLSYADGGIVDLVRPRAAPARPPMRPINVPATTARVVEEIQGFAKEGDLDEYRIAFLLRMAATNTIPEDRAMEFASEILRGDVQALIKRFQRYPRALRMLARLDLSLGGLAGQGYGAVANQHPRNQPQPTKRMGHDTKVAKAFAAGGEVGGHNEKALYDLSKFAVSMYGPQIGNNMIRRSEGDPNKLFFALNQYVKNVVGPRSQQFASNIKALNLISKKHRLQPVQAFNRTEDALETEQQLDKFIRDVPKKDTIFRNALLRMKAMVGWKPKPVRSQNG